MSPESLAVNGHKRSHIEVADALRTRIEAGDLRPGDRMPTQAVLAEEFGVERGVIRLALTILKKDGYLANVTKGSPATVAEPDDSSHDRAGRRQPESQSRPQPTMAALSARLVEAFHAPRVEIDALCLTSISLNLALSEPLRMIHEGLIKPTSVDVRVLLPARNINLAFPSPVGDEDGAGTQRSWLTQRNAQAQVLQYNLLALRSTHDIDVRVDFRALPFTPPVKLYLLNDSEALFAYYTISKHEASVEHEPMELYDVRGTQSLLFPFRADGGDQRDAAFVEQSQLWFNALWETITSDLTLPG